MSHLDYGECSNEFSSRGILGFLVVLLVEAFRRSSFCFFTHRHGFL